MASKYFIVVGVLFLLTLAIAHHRSLHKYGELMKNFDDFQSGDATNNLFIKYGGLQTVQTVVDAAVTNLVADPTLAPVFSVVGTPSHRSGAQLKSLLDLQISALLGAPFVYPSKSFTRGVTVDGRTMKTSHAGLSITAAQQEKFISILASTLIQCGVSAEDVAAVAPKLNAMTKDIVTVVA